MGVAMAGMPLPALNLLPTSLWVAVFTAFALWFVIENVRFVVRHGFAGGDALVGYYRAHYPLHIVMSLSMLYMYSAGSTSPTGQMTMSGVTGTTASFTFLPLIFTLMLCGFAVGQLDSVNRFVSTNAVVSAADHDLVTTPFDGSHSESGARSSNEIYQRDWLAPRLETACLIAMSITMALLLVRML
jgi:hypothetical protein